MVQPHSSETPTEVAPTASNDENPSNVDGLDKAREAIDKRVSREIIIGLCGPIGSGIKSVQSQLESVLAEQQYKVFPISVSSTIETYMRDRGEEIKYSSSNKFERYTKLMDAGNLLRNSKKDSICADLAISEISRLRKDTSSDPHHQFSKTVALEPRAYIINQLKHPEEVTALQKIYGNLFYLVGVLCDEERRKHGLLDEGILNEQAHELIQRDKKENDDHGQQLEKTLFHADFFINNSDPNASTIKALLTRFTKLVHGGQGITPTKEEYGMYAAHTASLQSACLSRQVGAAITNDAGVVVAVGHNDVPKFGGGLYSEDDNTIPHSNDFRCVHRDQRCHNDLHKQKLKNTLELLLIKSLENYNITTKDETPDNIKLEDLAPVIADSLYRGSQIKSIIEYSRAIHAEMDAIISLGRGGAGIGKGSVIYTTTFPCHNCARHIIAAGINTVIYIEPYEKSLALSLHDDALSYKKSKKKVWLKPFQGVAPSRYHVFFKNTTPEKNSEGKIIWTDAKDRLQVDKTFVDSYIERELKIAAAIELEKTT